MAKPTAAETLTLDTGERSVRVEVFTPPSREPAAGILLLHEIHGLLASVREDAADLASKGYLVYAPDLYTGGAARYCVRACVLAAGRANQRDSRENREISSLLDALKADARCNGRLGMIGACLTGGYVIQMARRPDMLAPVVYHHSLGIHGAGVPAEDTLEDVTRLQGHWARKDLWCPPKRRDRLIQLLGDRVDAHIYDMSHGFRSLSRKHPDSAVVWQRTLAWFDEHLRG